MEIITLDESQVRELYPIPVLNIGCWGFTMEGCLLTGERGKAVKSVFATFPSYIQHALTFSPESGGWADRARFWQAVLRPWLAPKQYHAAMQKFIRYYVRCMRRRPKQPLEIEKLTFECIAGEYLCECYRCGVNGEGCPVGSMDAELEDLSRETGKPVERLRHNTGLCHVIEMGQRAYEDGSKLGRPPALPSVAVG